MTQGQGFPAFSTITLSIFHSLGVRSPSLTACSFCSPPASLDLLRALRFPPCLSFCITARPTLEPSNSSTSTRERIHSSSPSNQRRSPLSMTRLLFIPPFPAAPPPQRQTLSPPPAIMLSFLILFRTHSSSFFLRLLQPPGLSHPSPHHFPQTFRCPLTLLFPSIPLVPSPPPSHPSQPLPRDSSGRMGCHQTLQSFSSLIPSPTTCQAGPGWGRGSSRCWQPRARCAPTDSSVPNEINTARLRPSGGQQGAHAQ